MSYEQVFVQYAVIASGSSVTTSPVVTGGALYASLHVPVVTSGTMFLRSSYDQTSANFIRTIAGDVQVGSQVNFLTGPGSLAVTFGRSHLSAPYLKFESSVAQTDNRTLVFAACVKR